MFHFKEKNVFFLRFQTGSFVFQGGLNFVQG